MICESLASPQVNWNRCILIGTPSDSYMQKSLRGTALEFVLCHLVNLVILFILQSPTLILLLFLKPPLAMLDGLNHSFSVISLDLLLSSILCSLYCVVYMSLRRRASLYSSVSQLCHFNKLGSKRYLIIHFSYCYSI